MAHGNLETCQHSVFASVAAGQTYLGAQIKLLRTAGCIHEALDTSCGIGGESRIVETGTGVVGLEPEIVEARFAALVRFDGSPETVFLGGV